MAIATEQPYRHRSDAQEMNPQPPQGRSVTITGYSENDPRHHTVVTQQMLTNLAEHARTTITRIEDPQAQVLFDTTARVLTGLSQSLSDYEGRQQSPN